MVTESSQKNTWEDTEPPPPRRLAGEAIRPSTSYELVRLNEAREALGLAGGSSDGDLQRSIGEASAVIVKFCNRTFATETVAETFRLESHKPALLLSRHH